MMSCCGEGYYRIEIRYHIQIWNRGAILEQKSRGILVKKFTTFQNQKCLLQLQHKPDLFCAATEDTLMRPKCLEFLLT